MLLILLGALIAVLVIRTLSLRRRLLMMNEHIDHAMNQIGVQIDSQFEALSALLALAKKYAARESELLIETVGARRSTITAMSAPHDVRVQEGVLSELLERISAVAEQYPELKANENYARIRNAVESYQTMVRTSCLIYNDSVKELNRELCRFPTSLLGGIFGFRRKDYFM